VDVGPGAGLGGANPTPALDVIRERVLGAVGWYLTSGFGASSSPELYQPPPSLEVLRLSGRANELFLANRYADAISLQREAFARDSTWLPVASHSAATYSNLGRWREQDSVYAYVEARRERLSPGDALLLDVFRTRRGSPEEELRAALAHFGTDSFNAVSVMWSSMRGRRPGEALEYYALRDTTTAWDRNWQAWDSYAGEAYRILGRHQEVVRIYDEPSRALGEAGLGWRILGMRDRILLGDTAGVLALVDSARTQPFTVFGETWNNKGAPLYYGAQILSLLGRGDEAVALLREAMNNGQRLGADEPLQWYWAPIKDHPGFQELVRVR
jgi:tetratricopeptide (TPR) repeat protein